MATRCSRYHGDSRRDSTRHAVKSTESPAYGRNDDDQKTVSGAAGARPVGGVAGAVAGQADAYPRWQPGGNNYGPSPTP